MAARWRAAIQSHVPLVVIGGINDSDRVAQVRQAGVQGVVVIEAATQASDFPAADSLPSCISMLITCTRCLDPATVVIVCFL
jgi:thiamine monophosphate synthase